MTSEIAGIVHASGVKTGLCTVFCRHTSAGIVIQENADPSVRTDLLGWLLRVAPDGDRRYEHDTEGPDDMAAHIRTVLTRTSETIPVSEGRLLLGTWQGIYLVEHRTHHHTRELVIHVQGQG